MGGNFRLLAFAGLSRHPRTRDSVKNLWYGVRSLDTPSVGCDPSIFATTTPLDQEILAFQAKELFYTDRGYTPTALACHDGCAGKTFRGKACVVISPTHHMMQLGNLMAPQDHFCPKSLVALCVAFLVPLHPLLSQQLLFLLTRSTTAPIAPRGKTISSPVRSTAFETLPRSTAAASISSR